MDIFGTNGAEFQEYGFSLGDKSGKRIYASRGFHHEKEAHSASFVFSQLVPGGRTRVCGIAIHCYKQCGDKRAAKIERF